MRGRSYKKCPPNQKKFRVPLAISHAIFVVSSIFTLDRLSGDSSTPRPRATTGRVFCVRFKFQGVRAYVTHPRTCARILWNNSHVGSPLRRLFRLHVHFQPQMQTRPMHSFFSYFRTVHVSMIHLQRQLQPERTIPHAFPLNEKRFSTSAVCTSFGSLLLLSPFTQTEYLYFVQCSSAFEGQGEN